MPKPELLETFPNPYGDRKYEIFMETTEFTSLCPLGGIETDAAELKLLEGGAPDFATIRITYQPAEVCLELKSLKMYLWSFRNDGIFYERAVNRILDDLVAACNPHTMTVVGDFNVRGGLKSIITATAAKPA
ncbi:MAG: NADPH-dependent 7-cyano-7-deazaguanine reductase QueF [Gemmatimonadetes bacterium]|nr:MAG: NADPH-dependent 7-cyano-7-deazaguanine reductase QueF [Gemmatimonadota bacterium]